MKKTNNLPFEIRKKGTSNEELASQLADIAKRTRKHINEFPNIQSALDSGFPLKITSGVYLCDSLNIPSNTDIEADQGAIIKSSSAVSSTLIAVNGSNIRVKGLTFDGDNKRATGVRIYTGSQNISLENCTIKNIYSTIETVSGIRIEGNTQEINIENCKIDNIVTVANTIDGDAIGTSRGILISKYSTEIAPKNIKINKCKISNILPREDGDGIVIQGWTNRVFTIISNNFFTNCAKRAIKIMCPGVEVINNQIENLYIGSDVVNWIDSMYSYISVYESDVLVQGNQLLGGTVYNAIDIGNGFVVPKNVKILNNHIILESTGARPYLGAITMTSDVEDVDISGNTIVNSNTGIYVRKRLVGATLSRNTIQGITGHGIRFDSYQYVDMRNITISDNNIYAANNAILIQGGQAVITGNNGTTGAGWEFVKASGADVRLKGNISDLYYVLPTPSSFYRDFTIVLRNAGIGDSVHVCVMNADNTTYRWTQTKTGTLTFNGDGTTTSKTIAHGLTTTPSYFHVERASFDAGTAGIKYVSVDATNITVFFNTAPISGTNNVVLKWKAEA